MHKTERCDMVIDMNGAAWSEAPPATEKNFLLAPGSPGAGQQVSSSTGLWEGPGKAVWIHDFL